MINKRLPLILLFLCTTSFSSCVSTKLLKIEPSNPETHIVWKKITKHEWCRAGWSPAEKDKKDWLGCFLLFPIAIFTAWAPPTVATEVSGEFSVKITGPSGEIFNHLSSRNLISYGKDGVAKLRVYSSEYGSLAELAKVSISPNWQSRYDNGESVQVPEIAEISFVGKNQGKKTELKATGKYSVNPYRTTGFPDPYNIVVKYETKYDPDRPAQILKDIQIKQQAELLAQEKMRLEQEQKKMEEEASMKAFKDALKNPEKLSSLRWNGWREVVKLAVNAGYQTLQFSDSEGTVYGNEPANRFVEFVPKKDGLYWWALQWTKPYSGRLYQRQLMCSHVPVPLRRLQLFLIRKGEVQEFVNQYGEKERIPFNYLVGVVGRNIVSQNEGAAESATFTYDPVEIRKLLIATKD